MTIGRFLLGLEVVGVEVGVGYLGILGRRALGRDRLAVDAERQQLVALLQEHLLEELLDRDVRLGLLLGPGALERRIAVPDGVVGVVIVLAVFLAETESLV